MTRCVSAPGKAFLIGEWGVLHGGIAVVTATSARAHAHPPRAGIDPPVDESVFVRQAHDECDAVFGGTSGTLTITTEGFVHGARKMGFGSSAALTAAVAAARAIASGGELASADVRAKILGAATRSHANAQGGRGSGADVAAAVLGGTLRFREGTASPLEWPTWLHVAFFDAGAPASTRSLLATVEAATGTQRERHAAIVEEFRAAAHGFVQALAMPATSGFDPLFRAVARHCSALRDLGELAGVPLCTPEIDAIINTALWHEVAAKPSGAGGGDIVVAFARSNADLDRLAIALRREHGVRRLTGVEIGCEGVRVEPRPPVRSRLPGFYRRGTEERQHTVGHLTGQSARRFAEASLPTETAARLVENVVGTLEIPMGIATNFRINGRDWLVPMCIEEASVVAAASNAARMVRAGGGFVADVDPPWMIAQVHLVGSDGRADAVIQKVLAVRDDLLGAADENHPRLVARGGGAREIEPRRLGENDVAVHVIVDCRDAMGANLLNTVAESVAPLLGSVTGWEPRLRILSNLADRRSAHASATVPVDVLAAPGWSGPEVADVIVDASRFASLDPYRAATHNKGIMNGVDAVALATGNDWRAVEAAAHAFASVGGSYGPLGTWVRDPDGALHGRITLPTPVGVVGGVTRSHPGARLALDILGGPSASELGQVMACVGLASNLAALRALATEGISRGHMALHARAVALSAGAEDDEIERVASTMIEVGEIKPERAATVLAQIRGADD